VPPQSPDDPARQGALPAPTRSGAHDLAFADDLTGLANRRYLRRLFETEWEALVHRHGRVALMLLDLDLFKEVNDTYGHLAGDAVLRSTARRLRESFRDEDRVVRYGGDEFVVVLPGAGDDEARALAERARSALATERWIDPATGRTIELPLSFSIGVAAAPEDGQAGEEVLAVADRQLYEEKRARRAALESVLGPGARRGAPRGLLVAGGALAAAALAAFVWLSRPQPLAPPALPLENVERLVAAEEVERREAELRDLREEVERLRAALAGAGSSGERERFAGRIRELEAALAARAAAGPPPAPSGTPPPAAPAERVQPPPARAPEPSPLPAPTAAPPAPAPAAPAPVPRTVAPQLVGHRPPVYPALALSRGLEARVDFRVRVGRDGQVIGVTPLGAPAGAGFDEAARVAALSATYRPGTRDGVPVEMETTLRIEFKQRPER